VNWRRRPGSPHPPPYPSPTRREGTRWARLGCNEFRKRLIKDILRGLVASQGEEATPRGEPHGPTSGDSPLPTNRRVLNGRSDRQGLDARRAECYPAVTQILMRCRPTDDLTHRMRSASARRLRFA